MITVFPKNHVHVPFYFILNASGKTLGRLATTASKLLRGKESSYYTPGVNQGNFVMIINSDQILVSGKKRDQKIYYSPTQRPGNLKSENYKSLKARLPSRIIERAVYGMLPKGTLGRNYYKRLYVYSGPLPTLKKGSQDFIAWKEVTTN
jgi:large subunit ribosomal protein L13